MADEQIIYVSPEEELTNIRERLERVQARRITLVIPPQTHLRSHVGWRVLHARTRELGKEVLVISSDRQIRAVAKAVGFRVAESQESPTPNKSRPGSRPQGSGRPQGSPPQRGGRVRREDEPGSVNRPASSINRPSTLPTSNRTGKPRRESEGQRLNEARGRSRREFEEREEPPQLDLQGQSQLEREGRPQGSPQQGPLSTFQGPDDTTSKIAPVVPESHGSFSDDFHIETSPSVSPRVPQHDEEELPDSLIDNYNQAQIIRKQFLGGDLSSFPPAPPTPSRRQEDYADQGKDQDKAGSGMGGYQHQGTASQLPSWDSRYEAGLLNREPLLEQEGRDVYEFYLEDAVPVSLPEQRGSALIEEVDTSIPDLPDITDLGHRPTDLLNGDIEDLGDEGEILVQPDTLVPDWDEAVEDEVESPSSPRAFGSRFQTGRDDIDDAEELPPVPDRPTLVRQQNPPSQTSRSGALPPAAAGAGFGAPRNRGQQSSTPPQTHFGAAQPESPAAPVKQAPKRGRQVTLPPQASTPVRPTRDGKRTRSDAAGQAQKKPVSPVTPGKTTAQRKNDRKVLTGFLIVVACALILAGLFYLLPSARITITIPSRPLTVSALHFSASTNAQNTVQNTVSSQVLSFEKSVTGSGDATGTSQVGNAKAMGSVLFTNRGAQPIDIPTSTTLATSNGIQFVTTADALIPPPSSGSTPPIPVEAMNAGTNGNVAAGSITVIPNSSLAKIAQDNNVSASSLNLSVTNTQALMGGGAVAASAVTTKDIQSEKTLLDKQLQADLQSWLAQQVHAGDITGTPAQQSETVTATPQEGKITKDGKFSETVLVHTTVLVLRAATLKAAAAGALNAKAMQMKPASMLVTGQQVTLSKVKSSPSKDGHSIAITLDATGQIIQRVSTDDIRNALAGKSTSQASRDINNGLAGLHGVLRSNIVESPGFLPILPFRADNITVILLPVPATTPGVPNA